MKTVIKDSSAQYVLRCRGGRGLRNNPMTVNIFGNVLHMSLRESAFQMISQVKSISKKHNVLMRQTPLKSNSFLALASPVWSLPNRTPKTSLHLVQFSASPESVHPTRHSGKHTPLWARVRRTTDALDPAWDQTGAYSAGAFRYDPYDPQLAWHETPRLGLQEPSLSTNASE